MRESADYLTLSRRDAQLLDAPSFARKLEAP